MPTIPPVKLSIVLSTHQTQFDAVAFKGDFVGNVSKIASMGYAGVELAVRDPGLIDQEELCVILDRNNLQVPAIGTGQAWNEEKLSFTNPDRLIRKATIARIKDHITFAHKLNAMVIIGLIRGVTPQGQTKQQSIQFLGECMSECIEFAEKSNTHLALEPINRYETDLINNVNEGCEFVQEIGSPYLGLLLDTFHMNIEEPDIEQSIQATGKNVFHFHVADSNRWYPGAGHINFKSTLRALFSTGYQNWISGEFLPFPDSSSAALSNFIYMNQLLGDALTNQDRHLIHP